MSKRRFSLKYDFVLLGQPKIWAAYFNRYFKMMIAGGELGGFRGINNPSRKLSHSASTLREMVDSELTR